MGSWTTYSSAITINYGDMIEARNLTTNSGVYNKSRDVGMTLTASIIPTNRVVTITAYYSTNANGPWTRETRWPALSWTNSSGNMYYRNVVTMTNQ